MTRPLTLRPDPRPATEPVNLETKVRALVLVCRHLGRTVGAFATDCHKGVANGDHVLIVEGNLYRVDLCLERVTRV